MTKKARIIGWHHGMNTGDDAMLNSIGYSLQKFYGIQTIYSHRGGIKPIICHADQTKNLTIAPALPFSVPEKWLNFSSRYLNLQKDMLIFGGGNIFHSENSIQWKRHILNAYNQNNQTKKAVIASVSIGPFPNTDAEFAMKDFLRHLDGALFRDAHSLEWSQTLDLPYKPAAAPDSAFFLSPNLPENRNKSAAGIAVLKNSDQDNKFRHIELCLKNNGFIKGSAIILYDFCGHPKHGDYLSNKALQAYLENCGYDVSHYPYTPDPQHTLNHIHQNCSLMIGERLHSQIFALRASTPLIPLYYHEKNKNVLSYAGHHGQFYDIDNLPEAMPWTVNKPSFHDIYPLNDVLS